MMHLSWDVASGVERVPTHPRASAGPHWTYYIHAYVRSRLSEFSCDTYDTPCDQLSSFEVSEAPIETILPAGAPWSRLGPQIKSKRDPSGWAPGAMYSSRKILATSMHLPYFTVVISYESVSHEIILCLLN